MAQDPVALQYALKFSAALSYLQEASQRFVALEGQAPLLYARIDKALEIIESYGQIEGDHHRAWVIDQVVRALTGKDYDAWVAAYCAGEEGPETYDWWEGIAP